MLAALLAKLTMVAATLAVVCWIGWSVPASHVPEPLQAIASPQTDLRALETLPLPTVPATVPPPLERRHEKSPRNAATLTLDLNRATEQDLERLPGIGHVLAARIVEYRAVQGAFSDIEQLRRVKGIGKKKFEQIRTLVTVVPPGASKSARKTA